MKNLEDELMLERYRHVLSQMARLDESAHKMLAVFQTSASALVAGIGALWFGYLNWGLSASIAQTGVRSALYLTAGIAILTVAVIVIGAFAWMDYRKEESQFLSAQSHLYRPRPTWRNLWRWPETYMATLIGGTAIVIIVIGNTVVLPILSS